MPLDIVKDKLKSDIARHVDITFKKLVDDSQAEVDACRDKIKKLCKSIIFFKKKDDLRASFPGDKR